MLHTLAGFLIVKSLDQLLWKRFQNAGKSSERISANAQLARKRNSYANFVQNQSKNREWIRTTKTAWSESTETATALLVPANMYIIQLHTWECVLLNKLVQTLCLWNNLCIGHYTKSIKKTSKIDSDFDMHGDGQILTRTGEGQILTCMASGRFGHALGGRADFDMHGDGRHHFHNHFQNSSPSLPKLNGCGIIFQQILYVCEIILKSCSRIFLRSWVRSYGRDLEIMLTHLSTLPDVFGHEWGCMTVR